MSTVLCETTRGGRVESVHAGSIAVVDATGRLVASAGDPNRFAFYRSSSKPFQAVPVIESGAADRFGFTPSDLALCCASHNAEERHQAQVLAMLAKLGLDDGALQCGAPLPTDDLAMAKVTVGMTPKSPLQCDCSGKHTGMLAACLAKGWPIENYMDPGHPLQQWILQIISEVCRVDPETIVLGTDGCSLPTFGLTVRDFATSWAALAVPEQVPAQYGGNHAAALNRLRNAMMAHPENVAGEGELVTNLMAFGEGRIVAKSGAEGLFCVGIPEKGLGLAIRVDDGSYRSHQVIVVSILEQLKVAWPELVERLTAADNSELRNHNNRLVGELRASFELAFA